MSTLTSCSFPTADGETLVGEIAMPDAAGSSIADATTKAAAAKAAVTKGIVLCHPHPLHGGTMDAPVIDALFRALPEHGVACLRFNFRGVAGSSGTHGETSLAEGVAIAEQHDVVAAIDELLRVVPSAAIWLGGWSFGADVSLAVADDRHVGWYAVAAPLAIVAPNDMAAPTDARPKVLAVPEHDQFNPPASVASTTANWQKTSHWVVPGADHFLAGGLDRVVELGVMAVSPD